MKRNSFLKYVSGIIIISTVAVLIACCSFYFKSEVYATTVYGDVSGDGIVDSADFTLLRKYLLGLQKTLPAQDWQQAGDVNLDEIIDSADYTILRKYLMMIIKSLPVGVIPATPTSIPPTGVYQAEEATVYNGLVETTNTGYSGSAYVNYDNAIGSYVEWKVNVALAGPKSLTFRYANGTTVDRPMEIKVNDRIIVSSVSFNSTGSWTDWKTNSIIANMNAGTNIIRATSTTANGGPNVDCLEVTASTSTPTPTVIATPIPTSAVKPVVYIAGDSTVMSYNASYYPQQGWGKIIPNYFTSDVNFVNRAIGGRSSKSFVVDGRLDEILNVIKSGDYMFIQFGHNDASTVEDRHTDASTTYKQYLKMYIDGARAHNATPVLITPVGRYNYKNGAFVNDFPAYCTAMKEVAAANNVKIIDLMTKSLQLYTSLGSSEAYKLFLVSSNGTDYTHFTETGANEIAKLVAQGVKEINIPISRYVK